MEDFMLRLSWEQIKETYPEDYVGLSDIETDQNGGIAFANVSCSTKETSYEDMLGMAIDGKIHMTYPNADQGGKAGVIT